MKTSPQAASTSRPRRTVELPAPRTDPPAPLDHNGLRVIPLGGLGEIGRNMTVFEYGGRLLIVDCGVLFPEPDQPGVDLILPDFGYLEGRLDQVEALVLTHAHEDHIGAVPYLLRNRGDMLLVGSKLTLALVRSKLTEHRLTPETEEVREGTTRTFGPFELEFFAVNHSIPDALAVAIKTPAGVVLHTGDFKMDQLPLDGRLTDLAGFARLGGEGVDLLLSDSTNAEVPGIVRSERDIAPVLDEVFANAAQRIIVACFASHVHRVQQVLDTAVKHRRKVAFVGRSMVRNMGVARDLGYLHVPGGLLVDLREAEEMPPGDVVLISTGSQGEPMSALSRMAGRDHPIRIAPGDTVILASSLIPGNETAVYRVINGLTRLGARVVHKESSLVHVSGHAPAGELLYVLNLVKPRNFMPVHGEWRHLRAHARLASLTGVPDDHIVIAEDGVVVDLVDGQASIAGAVPCGYVYVDGLTVGEVTESQLKDRRILGDEGFISVVMVVDSNSGKIVGGPEIHARGSGIDEGAFCEVLPKLQEALERAAAEGISDTHALRQLARRVIGKWVSDNFRRRPMIIPVVVEVYPNRRSPRSEADDVLLLPDALPRRQRRAELARGARRQQHADDRHGQPGARHDREPVAVAGRVGVDVPVQRVPEHDDRRDRDDDLPHRHRRHPAPDEHQQRHADRREHVDDQQDQRADRARPQERVLGHRRRVGGHRDVDAKITATHTVTIPVA